MSKYSLDGHKLFYHFEETYKILTDQPVNPLYVEISPVGNCNHRCWFCGYDYMEYKSLKLETEKTIQAIKEFGANGTKAMLFAGSGEPLLHKDFEKFVIAAYESNIDSGVFTNGVLLNPKMSEKILDKLTFIRFSFNGGDRYTYKNIHCADDFDKVVKNIQYAVDFKNKHNLGVDFGLQLVAIPENIKSIPSLAKLCVDLGLNYFVVKPFYKHPDHLGYNLPDNYNFEDYAEYLKQAESYATQETSTVVRWDTFIKQTEEKRVYDHCYGLPLFAVITANGDVYSCISHMEEDTFYFGNIYDNTVTDILNGELRKKVLEFARQELNCKEKCIHTCRLDAINRSLWELKHPTVKHVNFI